MQYELMRSDKAAAGVVLDPRTKIALVVTVSSILISGGGGSAMIVIRPALAAVPLFLLLGANKGRAALVYSCVYGIAYWASLALAPKTAGIAGFLTVAVSGTFSRMMPGLMLGGYMVSTTTVSEFTAALERLRIPQEIIIPFSVMLRFFPTVREEASAIDDAMRMRGIRFGGGRPASMFEYRLVPLLMSAVKIGEELSASALTRGLGGPKRRTNICQIGIGPLDWALLALAAASWIGFSLP